MEKKIKTALFVGGFGFLGTNFIKYIEEHGLLYEVIVFDKLSSHPYGVSSPIIKKCYTGDFSDGFILEQVFKENHIDRVFHCLSTTVPSSTFNPRYDIESNLIPTINLLDLMVRYNVEDILFISSGGAVYGESDDGPHFEKDELFPKSSYGITKISIEKYLFLYKSLYGIRPLIIRPSNPYGHYQFSEKQGIVNIALRSALQGRSFQVWGNGSAKKDYIYIDDLCRIVFTLIQKGTHSSIINVASGELIDVNDILRRIKNLIPSFQWEYSKVATHDVQHFSLDTSKLNGIIGQQSYTSFNEGLILLYEWQKKALDPSFK